MFEKVDKKIAKFFCEQKEQIFWVLFFALRFCDPSMLIDKNLKKSTIRNIV